METEKELNAKILAKTMEIHTKYPELSKFISEMPGTIPDEKNPEITIQNLKKYYETLNETLKDYLLEKGRGSVQPLNEPKV
jgi:hypothetical protein